MDAPRIVVALLTPFTAEGKVDVRALREHAADLLNEGVNGFLLGGSTGEGPLLDDDEVGVVTREVAAIAADGLVATQIGRASTHATLRLLRVALDAGAKGVAAVTPYYYELDDAQLESHYAALIEAARPHPVYADAIPRRTGNDVSVPLLKKLADQGLAGIMDSTRMPDRHVHYLEATAGMKGFEVYLGTDSLALAGFQNGAAGVVSAIANFRPELFLALRRAVRERREEEALELQHEIDEARGALRGKDVIEQLKVAVGKRMQAKGKSYPATMRAPLGGGIR